MMIPFEYTMVRNEETIIGINEMMREDIEKLKSKGTPISSYPKQIEQEIRENPSDPVGYVKKSMWFQKSNPKEAISAAEEGLNAVGGNHLLYHSRAMVLELAGQREAAISDLRKAVDIYPIAVETLATLGTLLNRDKKYREAIEYWDRLIEMNAESWMAWNGKAKAEYELGDYQRAVNHLTATTFCLPKEPTFYQNRGQVLLDMDKTDEALTDFEKSAELGAKREQISRDMKKGTLKLLESGNYRDLVKIYEKASEIDPENIDTLTGLLAGYKFLNAADDISRTADKLYRASLSLDDPMQLEVAAQILVDVDKLREAAGVTERLYKITRNRGYLMNLANIAKALDDRSFILPYISELIGTFETSENDEKNNKFKNVGRNDPCPCGSGAKYKKCHGN